MTITDAIRTVVSGTDLDEAAMEAVIEAVVEETATQAQAAALLVALRMKGESVGEVVGAVRALRKRMRHVDWAGPLVDTCGTGGDGASTFNISTAAAIVAAACGAKVAKHGNRAVSGRVGGADVLEELGVKIDLGPEGVKHCLVRTGIAFMYAPRYHPAFKVLAEVRRQLGVRTIVNLLGPLLNPAGARVQLIGVFAEEWVERLARALAELGAERALVVHGMDGVDEITLGAETSVCEVRNGSFVAYRIKPEDFGLGRCVRDRLAVGSARESAATILKVLRGDRGPCRDVVCLNAAAVVWIAGAAASLAEGLERAAGAIESGAAEGKLAELVAASNEAAGG